MNEFENYLLSGKNHAKLSAEALELMGKQAANLYLDEGIPLNDGIARIAGEHPDISAEQIKRIVEFANTAVYLAKHDQNKNAGREYSYPQFELADAGRIIQDLSDGARPTIVTKTDIDYARQAKKEKLSSPELESALIGLFKTSSGESEEKDYSPDTVVHELMAAKDLLVGLRDNIGDLYNQHEGLFKEAASDFYNNVKTYLLDGGSFGEVVAALGTVANDDDLKLHLEPVVARLIREKVASVQELKKQYSEVEKIAHRTVDPEHPIILSYSAMVLAGEELQKTAAALEEVGTELNTLNGFIKEAYFTKESLAPLVAAASRALPAIGRFAAGAGRGLLGQIGRGALNEFKNNPISTISTAKSLLPQRRQAPTPPAQMNPGY
jgi:hypothetical protein